ncbi:MAG: BlaI/MecI/CopY family transcriptional regulator [Caulobacterales bacterium]|nr:BlaI/MecI/CopY family transcriptional regulator [Caulobacterales bacterium]
MLGTLAPRERQIVDILYQRGDATVAEVREALPDRLTASAVRAMLTRLEAKGMVERGGSERGFVYAPRVPQSEATRSALSQVVKVFFNGSAVGAASALLDMSGPLKDRDLDELERLIAEARRGGR